MEKFRAFFEDIYSTYNRKEFVHTDPIFYPHTLDGNKEFTAITAACFAYGNVKAIKSFLTSFFAHYGTDPYNLNHGESGLYYRFQNVNDVAYYAQFMKRLYEKYGSVENVFKQRGTMEEGIEHFYGVVREMCPDAGQGFTFLFPNPVTSGAKRMRMFLRWMIRKDDIDFGLWDAFSPKALKMPIDTHILRFACNNGIIKNQAANRANLESVSSFFSGLNEDDPAKYDFALTRLGIVNDCQYQKTEICNNCRHINSCVFI